MIRSFSSYYGPVPRANAFPQYTDVELRRDLDKALDDATRANIEAELARRAVARKARKAAR